MDSDVKGHLIISGLVQGVGYRFFTQNAAAQLGLRGFVRNLRNGDVEVVVEGPQHKINRLIQQLRRGPFMSHVHDIRIKWAAATDEFSGFSIRH